MYATYTENAIMTMGATEEAAVAEVEEIAGQEFAELTETNLCEITPTLAAHVEEHGGVGIRWGTLPDGRLCTEEEEDAIQTERA